MSERAEHIPVQIFATDLNERHREGARRPLFEEHRGRRLAGAIAPFLHGGGGRLRVSSAPRHVRLRATKRHRRPAFLADGLDQLPQPADLPRAGLTETDPAAAALRPQPAGVLWLGSSETTGAASDLFEPEDKKHRFYAKKPATGRPRLNYPTGDQRAGKGYSRRPATARARRPRATRRRRSAKPTGSSSRATPRRARSSTRR